MLLGGLLGATALTTGIFGGGHGFSLVSAKRTDRLGMGRGLNVGQKIQIFLASGQPLQDIPRIGPQVQLVPGGTSHHRIKIYGSRPGFATANKQPVFATCPGSS